MLSKIVSGPSGTREKHSAAEATYYRFVHVGALKELICLRAKTRHLSREESCKDDSNTGNCPPTSSDKFIWVKLVPQLRCSAAICQPRHLHYLRRLICHASYGYFPFLYLT